MRQALVEGGGDFAAICREAGVEVLDILLQAVGDILRALAHALDDLAAEGFDGTVEFGDVTGDQRTKRAAVAGETFGKFSALVLHQLVEGVDLLRQGVVRALGLIQNAGDQRVRGGIERVSRLVAAGQDVGRETLAGLVDLADEITAAQFELEEQGIAGILQGIMDLLGTFGNALDDRGRALLEVADDAVDPLAQHVVDPIGKIGEFVVHVTGLEIEAVGQPFAGVEHRAGGFRAGFFKAVEQVAAALTEREDHVVAGIAQGAGDMSAALFKRRRDGLGDFVDTRGDSVRNQRDVVTKVDLHAGNGAANLFGLSDQVVALMRDVLQQRADTHLVVAVGTFQRRHFVGDEALQLAGARNRAFDTVAHRRDFAADRLSHGHHGIAGGAFGLREADRDLRHRLRDQAQFLAAPRQARQEIDQQNRRHE